MSGTCPRRIVLSRKGFDSQAGGCPSPVLGGRRISLPIPEPGCTRSCKAGHVRFGDLGDALPGLPLSKLVSQLTKRRLGPRTCVHLDPDLRPHLRAEPHRENPALLFGQAEIAQRELRFVEPGDLFLFFGLFRAAEIVSGKVRFVRGARPQHHIWGWLEVGAIFAEGQLTERHAHHPHAYRAWKHNTVYEAAATLSFAPALPGAGVFDRVTPQTVLTDPAGQTPARWRLPAWLAEAGMTRFDFTGRDAEGKRFWKRERGTVVNVAPRCKGCGAANYGQECIAETADRKDVVMAWLQTLWRGQDGAYAQSTHINMFASNRVGCRAALPGLT